MIKTMVNERMAICKQCPLYMESSHGPICNPKLWINKDGDISKLPKEGYVKGCSCKLEVKIRRAENHCVAGKW